MKKLWVSGVVCGGLLAGIGLAYARIIPGVDEPFDPPNYYSTVSVSAPDSAPSVFTLRELGVSFNTNAFVHDFWEDFISKDYKNNPDRYNDFIIRDNYGGDEPAVPESSIIRVGDNKVPINYKAFSQFMVGEDGDELSFIGSCLKLPVLYRGQNGLLMYLATKYGEDSEMFEKYIVQPMSGNVYDPERHRNSIYSRIKHEEIFSVLKDLLTKQTDDDMPFPHDGGLTAGIADAQRKTASLNLSSFIQERAEKVFLNEKMSEEEFNSRTPAKQMQFLNDVYKEVAQSAQKSIENSVERQRLMEIAMQRSASAQGTMQAEQAKAEINALLQEEYAERNMILDNIAAMEAAKKQYEVSKEIVDARNRMDARSMSGFSDPYHLDAYEKKHYEKPKPIGLPNF